MSHPPSSRLLSTILFFALLFFCHLNSFAQARLLRWQLPNLQTSLQGNQKLSKKEAEALKEIDRLYQESRKLIQAGQHDAAMPLAERALTLAEKTFASKLPVIVANAANNLGMIYKNKGDLSKAEILFMRSFSYF